MQSKNSSDSHPAKVPAEITPQEKKPLQLDQFLKICGIAQTGGHAKILIQGGEVTLNGEIEIRRKRKLSPTDIIEFENHAYPVADFVS